MTPHLLATESELFEYGKFVATYGQITCYKVSFGCVCYKTPLFDRVRNPLNLHEANPVLIYFQSHCI